MRHRVFIVNEPMRRNRDSGEMERGVDVRPAEVHGELVFLLPPGAPPRDPMAMIDALTRGLATFRPGDFLLPVGDLIACMVAASIVSRRSDGVYKLLRWSRDAQLYVPVEVDLAAYEQLEEQT